MDRRRWVVAGVLLAVMALASVTAGCSDDGVRSVEATTTTATPHGAPSVEAAGPSFRPWFIDSPCTGEVPAGPRVRCGWLVVRENRATTKGPTVRLPVAIVAGAGTHPSRVPVVYLAGGPGESGLDAAAGFVDQASVGDRDVILFDQRGTGAALPSLDCPEVAAALRGTFATTRPATDEQRPVAAAFARCRTRLAAAGVDLDQYRTATSADDVDDLRAALGYDQVDLFGASYGTTLALATMRQHPAGVRAAILDGVYPPSVAHGAPEVAANARGAIDHLVATCAAAPACSSAVPDLGATLAKAVDRLDRTPYATTISDPATGGPVPVRITGADLVAGLVQGMYRTATIPALPGAVAQVAAGDGSGIDAVASSGLAALGDLSEGLAASVECGDRQRIEPPGGLARAASSDPEMATVALIGALDDLCPRWKVASSPASFNGPVTADVPTLVLNGGFDPVTPARYGHAVASALPRATEVTLPTVGHGAIFSSACARKLADSFLSTPGAPLDTSCAASPATPWG